MDTLEQFRQETRAWLETNCPASMRTPATDEDTVWSGRNLEFKTADQKLWFERMRDKGWFAPDWPKKYGGGGLNKQEAAILAHEMANLNCRPPQTNLGIWMLGPVLLEFGTEAQKAEHLPKMARGEIRWCQGFSEPNAGSDLASLQMKAVIDNDGDGDDFIVNGSKIWTSYADDSDCIYCLVRTDPQAPKHEGIGFLMIDMTSPGVSVQPIELISGKSKFCQTFFDNVRVPRENLVGELTGGWSVAKRLMQHERKAIANLSSERKDPYNLPALAKAYLGERDGKVADPVLRDQLAGLLMDETALLLTLQRTSDEAKQGIDTNSTSSILKYASTELEKRKYETLLSILGLQGLGWEGEGFSAMELTACRDWLSSKVQSIGGGTSEIQLNVIAKRVLGL